MKGFDPLQYMDRKEGEAYDLFAQFALGAAHQAVTQAGLERDASLDPDRTGVIIGSGIGGMQTFEDNCTTSIVTKGPDRISPFFVPMFIPDIAAGLVSIRYGAQGPELRHRLGLRLLGARDRRVVQRSSSTATPT